LQRRQHDLAHMLRARGEHQQQFRLRMHGFAGAAQQQFADAFRQRRAARFAGADDLLAIGQQRLAQRGQHRALAGALAAFDAQQARLALQRRGHLGAAWRCAR
jgi:cellobiose-specific phosphotransferase system component IIA